MHYACATVHAYLSTSIQEMKVYINDVVSDPEISSFESDMRS